MLQEGYQAGHANHINRTRDQVVVSSCHRQRHVAAVAPARYHDSVTIKIGLLFEPAEQRFNVFVSVFPLESIIELHVALAITGRAAHVWENDPNTQLVEKIIVAALIDWAGLAFGTAVNIDNDWTLA